MFVYLHMTTDVLDISRRKRVAVKIKLIKTKEVNEGRKALFLEVITMMNKHAAKVIHKPTQVLRSVPYFNSCRN